MHGSKWAQRQGGNSPEPGHREEIIRSQRVHLQDPKMLISQTEVAEMRLPSVRERDIRLSCTRQKNRLHT